MINSASTLAPQVIAYQVFKPAGPRSPFKDMEWEPTNHTITILRSNHDHTQDQLFVDHVHIDSSKWKWRSPNMDLVWHQGAGAGHRGGHLALYDNHGMGTFSFGTETMPVQIQLIAAMYKCQVSANAGASINEKTRALTWDITSSAWQNAMWQDALLFGYYSFDYVINHVPALATACAFVDTRGSEACWSPWTPPEQYQAANLFKSPCGATPPDPGTLTDYTFAFQDLVLDFQLTSGVNPEKDSVGDKTISTVFPYRMTVQFVNQLFRTFNGAMLVNGPTTKTGGVVYAVKGQSTNASGLVGQYMLTKGAAVSNALISVHDGRLVIDGEKVETSALRHMDLAWHGLSPALAAKANIPTEGHITFSPDGATIERSSFGATGQRVAPQALGAQRALLQQQPLLANSLDTTAPGPLNVDGLLTMHNYELREISQGDQTVKSYVDIIQQPTLDSFYKIAQYYMDPNLRETYITKAPIELNEYEKEVASNNANNKSFYQSLQVPYLTDALARAGGTDDNVKHLNAARARKFLTSEPGKHSEFSNQVSLLYQDYWKQQFPMIKPYLDDQAKDHRADIEKIRQDWISEIQAGAESIADPNDPYATMNAQVKYVNDLATKAASTNTYWAFQLYLYLVSNEAVQAYQKQVNSPTTPDASESMTLLLQTNNAVLNVLDPSGYFSGEYTEVLQMFNLSGLLTNWVDYGGNLSDFSYVAVKILRGYIDTYVNSLDPQIAEKVQELQKALTEETLNGILGLFTRTLAEAGVQGSWGDLMAIYDRNLLSYAGTGFALAARMFAVSMGIFAIYMMIEGKRTFDSLTPTEQAKAILGGIALLAQFSAYIIKGGVRTAYFLDGTATFWSRTKQFFRIFNFADEVAQTQIAQLDNSLVRWLARGNKVSNFAAARAVAAGAGFGDETLLTKLFGRSLDEFIALRLGTLLAIGNLILSAYQLAHDTDNYDKIVDSVFVAAAALDVIALTAEWSLAYIAAESVGALALSWVAAIAGPLALIASIVGIILFFYFMSLKNPLLRFAEDYAKPNGYYMDQTAIDYFAIDRSKDGTSLPAGLTLLSTSLTWEKHSTVGERPITYYNRIINKSSQALTFNSDGAGGIAVNPLSHAWNNVFSLSVDDKGMAQFYTVSPDRTSPKALGLAVDGGKVVAHDLSKDLAADNQQWIVNIISSDSSGGDGGVPSEALVTLQNTSNGKYLAVDLSLVDNFSLPPDTVYDSNPPNPTWCVWTLKRAYTGVSNVSYSTLQIFVDPTNTASTTGITTAYAFVGQSGQEPYTWSLQQPLPDYLSFDSKTGTVAFTKFSPKTFTDQEMKDMAEKKYGISVSSKLENGTSVGTSAQLTVEVRDIRAPYAVTYRNLCLVVNNKTFETDQPALMPFVTGQWSVSPALPTFLRLNMLNGTIEQKATATATMPETIYTVTLKNGYGQVSTPVKIRVNDANTPCP